MNSSSNKAENQPVAIIGGGYVADCYVRSKALHPDIDIVGAFDIRRDRLGAFCKYWHLTAFDSLEALLSALPDDGVILNLTPPEAHNDVTRACLDAGRHVYSQKPLTVSAEETDCLLDRAHDAQVLLTEAIWTLALPGCKNLARFFTGCANALLRFDFSYPVGASGRPKPLDPQTGGALIDQAVYGYAASITMLREVARQSDWVTRSSDGLETKAEMGLKYAEGARSMISLSIDRIGPNLPEETNASELIALGPSFLAAETLRRVPCRGPARTSTVAEKPRLKSRQKAAPALRPMKARLPPKRRLFGYGSSSCAPIRQELVSTVENNLVESDIVPHRLSNQVSHLIEAPSKRGKDAQT